MSSFNQGCMLCKKIAVKTIPSEWGYAKCDYHLCEEHLESFVQERGVKL